jgi:lambda family phage tail tape measure protein
MREFENENRLFSEGFKRVWSDAIMPAYTDIANVFKNGWPSIVQAFRVVVSSVVGLGYAMADGLYIAYRSVKAAIGAIGEAVMGVSAAVVALKNGDLKGAGAAIAGIWDGAKNQVKSAGKDMVDVILENDKKIRLATGADGRNTPIELVKNRPNAGRVWQPKPTAETPKAGPMGPIDDPAKKALEGYLREQEDFIAAERTQLQTREQFLQGYYQQEYLTAKEFYGKQQELTAENLKVELDAYDREIAALKTFRLTRDKEQDKVAVDNKVAELERKKAAATVEANKAIGLSIMELGAIQRRFNLDTKEWSHQRDVQNEQAAFNIDMLGRSTLEVQKLTEAHRIDAEVQERIYQLRKKDPDADVSGALLEAEKQKQIAMQMIQAAWDKQSTAAFGASEAIRKYGEEAKAVGYQVENVMTNAFHGIEDAFAQFVTTGKLNFKDLINSITADLARMSIKTLLSQAMDAFKGSAMGGALSGIFGQKQGGGAGGAIVGAATGATTTASTTAANTALTTLGTSAGASSTALTTMTASVTSLDGVSATLLTSFGTLAAAAEAAATALASTAGSSGASSIGALAGAAGSSAGGDAGWAAMLAGSFAGGGDPPVGRVSLVGEKGPELFVPKTAGTILPNDFFKNAAANDSGTQQNLTVHITNTFAENTSKDTINQAAARQSMQVQRAMRSIG